MAYSLDCAFQEFLLYLQEDYIEEAPELTDEEYFALPEFSTRAEQWGIAITGSAEDDAYEAMKAYWIEYRDAELVENIS